MIWRYQLAFVTSLLAFFPNAWFTTFPLFQSLLAILGTFFILARYLYVAFVTGWLAFCPDRCLATFALFLRLLTILGTLYILTSCCSCWCECSCCRSSGPWKSIYLGISITIFALDLAWLCLKKWKKHWYKSASLPLQFFLPLITPSNQLNPEFASFKWQYWGDP